VLVLRDELKLTEDFNRQASRGLAPGEAVRLAAMLARSRPEGTPLGKSYSQNFRDGL